METWYYEVVSIDGDYANLKRCDIESADLKLVARALLLSLIHISWCCHCSSFRVLNGTGTTMCRPHAVMPVPFKTRHEEQ